MPPNESRTLVAQGAAENYTKICTAKCTTEDKPRLAKIQVANLAEATERRLRQAHLLAIDVDLFERTQASKLLRDLAYQAWCEVYLDAA